MEELSEDTIKELKDKHGPNLHAFKCPGSDPRIVVVRAATHVEWKRFRQQVGGGKTNAANALDALCGPCFIYPEKEDFREISERWPGFISNLHVKIQEISGAVDEIEGKAL